MFLISNLAIVGNFADLSQLFLAVMWFSCRGVQRLRIQRKEEEKVQLSLEPFPVFVNLTHFSPASRQGLLYKYTVTSLQFLLVLNLPKFQLSILPAGLAMYNCTQWLDYAVVLLFQA